MTINIYFLKRVVFIAVLLFGSFSLTGQTCAADPGTLAASQICFQEDQATISASPRGDAIIPDGFETIYVLTSSEDLVIEGVNNEPSFEVIPNGLYTIHTLIYESSTLDLGIVELGVTTGFDVNALLIQGGGSICAALDVAGNQYKFGGCEPDCEAMAGTLLADNQGCVNVDGAMINATIKDQPTVPAGFEVLYVLTAGEGLVIQNVNDEATFTVTEEGLYTIHTLVYDQNTLDLGIVEIGTTTGFDVNSLLIQGGGAICGALDVAGASFTIEACPNCDAWPGTLIADSNDCLEGENVTITATRTTDTVVPEGFEVIYVLTSGNELVIENVDAVPNFAVTSTGLYTIHTLVYDPMTLDLSIVTPGETTGFDVNGLLIQGGGDICAALDVAGASFTVEKCQNICEADAGSLHPGHKDCIDGHGATIEANISHKPFVPSGFERLYVLTSGDDLVIEEVNTHPNFGVAEEGLYTIHTLIYDPGTLDLGIVKFGETTGFDVNSLLIQGGGSICGALDVSGAKFEVEQCGCQATAGTLKPKKEECIDGHGATITAKVGNRPRVPSGFEVIYVLTSGDGLVIQNVSATPSFTVNEEGLFTIHTLVYDPNTLDLGIVEIGATTGFDVNSLLIQGGGDICAALDVPGAKFEVENCKCKATAGTLKPNSEECIDDHGASITAIIGNQPTVPSGFEVIYVLTSGDGLVIQNVSAAPSFTVNEEGLFTIHTLVYDPSTLDLGIVEPGVTTGFDVNSLLIQGGGDICAALDVPGAKFEVENCKCKATAGTLKPNSEECIDDHGATITAKIGNQPYCTFWL